MCASLVHFFAGICEAAFMGADCNECNTGYYGDGNTCTTCGNKKTSPSGGATTADDCKCIVH